MRDERVVLSPSLSKVREPLIPATLAKLASAEHPAGITEMFSCNCLNSAKIAMMTALSPAGDQLRALLEIDERKTNKEGQKSTVALFWYLYSHMTTETEMFARVKLPVYRAARALHRTGDMNAHSPLSVSHLSLLHSYSSTSRSPSIHEPIGYLY
jgi:hypothetical protein